MPKPLFIGDKLNTKELKNPNCNDKYSNIIKPNAIKSSLNTESFEGTLYIILPN